VTLHTEPQNHVDREQAGRLASSQNDVDAHLTDRKYSVEIQLSDVLLTQPGKVHHFPEIEHESDLLRVGSGYPLNCTVPSSHLVTRIGQINSDPSVCLNYNNEVHNTVAFLK
jgi:hypothetical protein